MAKLSSVPPYPFNISASGIPVNLCKNKTPEGLFQIAKVLEPGGPLEGDFEILYEGTEFEADEFTRRQILKNFPGLI